ncbi:lysozyme inhibitor LprI family protein [uncultured Roseibium sp.]|uniref:lysozyme inhibitor LprI family protein n=1 Tax=uncultured Roseibium sp. TaxID=1936171 RepID=UPI0026231738|nr:lysozyme inhibitor LprI family protein [uncultured Roseibium sp.]
MTRNSRFIFLILGIVCVSSINAPAAQAQETIDCGYPLNNSERTYCADKALKDAEAKMASAYVKLHAKVVEMDDALPEHLKGSPAALEEAQAAWSDYSDKDCKAYAFPFMGGTRGQELYRNCKIVLTMTRTEDLTATLDDYGN